MLHQSLTDQIIGVFFDVYRELGYGYAEAVYSAAMLVALREAGLKVEREVRVPVYFRGHLVGRYRADLVAEDKVLIDNKAAREDDGTWQPQMLNYLRATVLEVGLLLHFGRKPNFQRLIFTNDRKVPPIG
jgi:GxxExxY protein